MTAAYRLKGLGRFASCVAIVLGFYLVSSQVASERKKLDDVNARIVQAQRDIRALETEFDTRANLAQLEKWNGDTLSLAAPTAAQFVPSEAALASLDVSGAAAAVPGQPEIRTAALLVPSAPSLPLAQTPTAIPAVAVAAAPAPKPVQVAAVLPVRQVTQAKATHLSVPPAPRIQPAVVRTASVERAVAVAKVRPQAVAMLDRKLLSDSTLGDILSGARAESGKRR